MANEPDGDRLKQKDAVWPFVGIYCFMLLGIFVSLGNTDPISMDFTPSVILGLSIVVGAIAYFAVARLKGHALFGFGNRTLMRNLGWHIFVLTGIIFLSHLFFRALISILVLSFQVPIFDASCKLPSERDVCLFVWDAIASGAFKFLTKYLDLAAPSCCTESEQPRSLRNRDVDQVVHVACAGLVRPKPRQGLVQTPAQSIIMMLGCDRIASGFIAPTQ